MSNIITLSQSTKLAKILNKKHKKIAYYYKLMNKYATFKISINLFFVVKIFVIATTSKNQFDWRS